MSEIKTYFVEIGERVRLDVFLTAETGETRSYVNKLNDGGAILVNGEKSKSGRLLKSGDVVTLTLTETVTDVVAEDIAIDIIYEDSDIAVINKAQGMSVHPSGNVYGGTLVNALMYKIKDLSSIGGVIRPGIVHRLDKNTSGVMVIAKNNSAHLSLSKQFSERNAKKEYVAIVEGVVKEDSGNVTTFIARSKTDRKKMDVANEGRLAITDFCVIERFKQNTYMRFNIKTGRTHQIRVHAKHMQHPIVGDEQYGYKKQRFNLLGQLLHSHTLSINHPTTGERMTFTAEIPDYFNKVLTVLRNENQ